MPGRVRRTWRNERLPLERTPRLVVMAGAVAYARPEIAGRATVEARAVVDVAIDGPSVDGHSSAAIEMYLACEVGGPMAELEATVFDPYTAARAEDEALFRHINPFEE